MQTFDIYLKKRLTEIDVIITQLVQRDAFSIYDWLNIFCSMDEIEVRKNLQIDSTLSLDAQMDNFLEYVSETIGNKLHLDGNVDLVNQSLISGETGMELFAEELEVTNKSFIAINSDLEISVDSLDYYIAHSFGKVNFDMSLLMNEVDTVKYSFDQVISSLDLSADIDFSSLKIEDGGVFPMYLDIEPTDLFYQLNIAGQSIMHLNVSPIDKYVLKKVLHDVNTDLYLSATSDIDWQLVYYLDMANSFELMADLKDSLIQLISIYSEMWIDCEASAGLKRYRLLAEIDDNVLADLDNMTLEELDYVILTD